MMSCSQVSIGIEPDLFILSRLNCHLSIQESFEVRSDRTSFQTEAKPRKLLDIAVNSFLLGQID